jgi:hypothetical protein
MKTGSCKVCDYRPVAFDVWECPRCGASDPNPGTGSKLAGRGMLIGMGVGALVGGAYGAAKSEEAWIGFIVGCMLGPLLGMVVGLALGLVAALISWLTGGRVLTAHGGDGWPDPSCDGSDQRGGRRPVVRRRPKNFGG